MNWKKVLGVVILFVFILAGCVFGNTPVSLAKQFIDLTRKHIANPNDENIVNKINLISEKVNSLSQEDKIIFYNEVNKAFGN